MTVRENTVIVTTVNHYTYLQGVMRRSQWIFMVKVIIWDHLGLSNIINYVYAFIMLFSRSKIYTNHCFQVNKKMCYYLQSAIKCKPKVKTPAVVFKIKPETAMSNCGK